MLTQEAVWRHTSASITNFWRKPQKAVTPMSESDYGLPQARGAWLLPAKHSWSAPPCHPLLSHISPWTDPWISIGRTIPSHPASKVQSLIWLSPALYILSLAIDQESHSGLIMQHKVLSVEETCSVGTFGQMLPQLDAKINAALVCAHWPLEIRFGRVRTRSTHHTTDSNVDARSRRDEPARAQQPPTGSDSCGFAEGGAAEGVVSGWRWSRWEACPI